MVQFVTSWCLVLCVRCSVVRILVQVCWPLLSTWKVLYQIIEMTSDESSGSDLEFGTPSKTNKDIEKFLKMKPDYISSQKSKAKSISELKSRLSKSKSSLMSKRTSGRNEDRKQVEDCLRDLHSDFTSLCKKFDGVYDCIHVVLDKIEVVESRLDKLEKLANEKQCSLSYSGMVKTSESERLEKLEYMTSEDERKNRLLHVTITHPQLEPNNPNLIDHTKQFLNNVLKMEPRTIDANMQVNKCSRNNTIIIILSHRRYKAFLYSARKNLRQENVNSNQDLFVNDNLTSYNFRILMKLKNERKIRIENGKKCFASVYTYEGRVFVKLNREDPSTAAINIRGPARLEFFLADLDAPQTDLVNLPSISGIAE